MGTTMTTTADVSVRTRSLQKVGLHVLDTEGEGPLTKEKALVMEGGLRGNREAFFDQFTKDFFSSAGAVAVREQQRNDALMMCRQSDQGAALQCMKSFGTEDFRRDLETITVPTLVLHRDSDAEEFNSALLSFSQA